MKSPTQIEWGRELAYKRGRALANPRGTAYDIAEVSALEFRILVCEHIGFDIAERGAWFLANTVIERLEDVLLEVWGARIFRDDRPANLVRVFGILNAQ